MERTSSCSSIQAHARRTHKPFPRTSSTSKTVSNKDRVRTLARAESEGIVVATSPQPTKLTRHSHQLETPISLRVIHSHIPYLQENDGTSNAVDTVTPLYPIRAPSASPYLNYMTSSVSSFEGNTPILSPFPQNMRLRHQDALTVSSAQSSTGAGSVSDS